jgi:hypothetical protein
VKTLGAERVRYGEEEIDLSAVEQIVESAQTRAIARAIAWGAAASSTGAARCARRSRR